MDLDAIEARANNATEGPWELPERDELGWYAPHQPDTFDDYVFTSRARADVPDLVARVRALEDENQRLRENARLKNRAAYLSAINACMARLQGQTDITAVFPALHEMRDRAVELHNAALSRARETAEEEV